MEFFKKLFNYFKTDPIRLEPLPTNLREKLSKPDPHSAYAINILNDNQTPMEYVVAIFEQYLCLTKKDATQKMLHVNNKGSIILLDASQHAIEELITCIEAEARSRGYPLSCKAVRIEDTLQA